MGKMSGERYMLLLPTFSIGILGQVAGKGMAEGKPAKPAPTPAPGSKDASQSSTGGHPSLNFLSISCLFSLLSSHNTRAPKGLGFAVVALLLFAGGADAQVKGPPFEGRGNSPGAAPAGASDPSAAERSYMLAVAVGAFILVVMVFGLKNFVAVRSLVKRYTHALSTTRSNFTINPANASQAPLPRGGKWKGQYTSGWQNKRTRSNFYTLGFTSADFNAFKKHSGAAVMSTNPRRGVGTSITGSVVEEDGYAQVIEGLLLSDGSFYWVEGKQPCCSRVEKSLVRGTYNPAIEEFKGRYISNTNAPCCQPPSVFEAISGFVCECTPPNVEGDITVCKDDEAKPPLSDAFDAPV
mmetsp:Transcript_15306/g.37103  ORF Transcript_15306/g.37103 Transcript_15306/m.37103 type:complete len:352 (+) Transcript_15306:193-1248(+)